MVYKWIKMTVKSRISGTVITLLVSGILAYIIYRSFDIIINLNVPLI